MSTTDLRCPILFVLTFYPRSSFCRTVIFKNNRRHSARASLLAVSVQAITILIIIIIIWLFFFFQIFLFIIYAYVSSMNFTRHNCTCKPIKTELGHWKKIEYFVDTRSTYFHFLCRRVNWNIARPMTIGSRAEEGRSRSVILFLLTIVIRINISVL